MAGYTRIINCRPCCNLYVLYIGSIVDTNNHTASKSVSQSIAHPLCASANTTQHRLQAGTLKTVTLAASAIKNQRERERERERELGRQRV